MAHTLIEDIQHGVVLIKTDFQTSISTEGDIAQDDTQADGNEQQGLKVLLDGQPDEEGTHCDHNEVAHGGIGKCRVGQELIEILYDELS